VNGILITIFALRLHLHPSVMFYSQNYNDMLGELYLQCEMPEPPKESFFKGLFGGGAKSIDREELCEYSIV
jgi:hypothetical protein